VEGWGKIAAGVVIGVAGTVYATNEELRKRLPKAARDLPDTVRQRFESAVSAAHEASSQRRAEILRDLERHDAAHSARTSVQAEPEPATVDSVSTTDGRQEVTENTEEGSR
jgi:uncharacterized membrane protein YccC